MGQMDDSAAVHVEHDEGLAPPQTVECLTCGKPSSIAIEYEHMGGKPVCSACALVITNIYWKYHSGNYLTWDNGPRTPAEGYQKKNIPEGLRWEVFERDGFACQHCGSQRYLRADHVVPESKGGPTALENLQTLCRSCNSKKGRKA
jgi:hypothetical protein